MYRASSSASRASSSYRGLTQEQRQNQARAEANALRQIEESQGRVSALRVERARTAASSSVRGKVADNIRAASVASSQRKGYLADAKQRRIEAARLDRINEEDAELERQARQRMLAAQGGYTKLTKMGILARIMNIKKKAAKAAKAKPTKPTTRKPIKPTKPITRKPTIVRRK